MQPFFYDPVPGSFLEHAEEVSARRCQRSCRRAHTSGEIVSLERRLMLVAGKLPAAIRMQYHRRGLLTAAQGHGHALQHKPAPYCRFTAALAAQKSRVSLFRLVIESGGNYAGQLGLVMRSLRYARDSALRDLHCARYNTHVCLAQ